MTECRGTCDTRSDRIRGRYKFNRRVGGIVGLSYFNADVTIDKSDQKTEIAYGFDGFFLGLDLGF